ncbi:hypothetical protein ACIREM_16535 [Streptomyces shenzhenensis]|uniref:hypothetical protein n=1 Tax=Streptomyces shenzhenensis TaxID=943815 RepID=UPI0037F13DAD
MSIRDLAQVMLGRTSDVQHTPAPFGPPDTRHRLDQRPANHGPHDGRLGVRQVHAAYRPSRRPLWHIRHAHPTKPAGMAKSDRKSMDKAHSTGEIDLLAINFSARTSRNFSGITPRL